MAQLVLLQGYPDYIGRRFAFCGNQPGPASYVQVTATDGGDPLSLGMFQSYIDCAFPAVTVSETYIVYPIPVAVGARQAWRNKWVTASTGAEVAASTNLSAESVQIAGFGGRY